MTDGAGRCSFSYQGPPQPGSDLISAYADSDDDAGEPFAVAVKVWTSSPECRDGDECPDD
jgi:hypothetical protein